MADIFQGSPLPAVTSTIEKQTVAPDFYTNYLQDVANLGQNAVTQGGVAGASPLQQQAYQMAPQVAFAGAGSLGNAGGLIGQAGTTTTPDVVQNYMNPYTSNVVDEMGRLAGRNVQDVVMPGLNAAGVATGGFGSQRQAQVTGQTLRDIQSNLTGQQTQALNTGYNNAVTNASADLNRTLQAGQGLTTLGQTQNQLGASGLTELSKLGAEQQNTAQKGLDYPMAQTQAFSKLLSGYNIPTGEVQQTTGPGNAGQYSGSPLAQIAGLSSLIQAIYGTKQDITQNTNPVKSADGGSVYSIDVQSPLAYHDGQGNIYDVDGNLVG